MDRLQSKITFTRYNDAGVVISNIVMDFVNDIMIDTSFETLTDKARITIPRNLTFNGKAIATETDSVFNRGDSVKIEAGYFPNIRRVFTGYITKPHSQTPIVLDCEDEMFQLKQKTFTFPLEYTTITKDKNGGLLKTPKKSYREIDLDELIDAIKTAVDVDLTVKNIAKVESLGHIRFSDVTPAQALEYLQDNYGIYSYFVYDEDNDEQILNIGLASDASDTNNVPFVFEERIIKENMEYVKSEEMNLKIVCISFNSQTNEKSRKQAGASDGETRTFHYLNLTADECQAHADNMLTEWRYDGYRGDFETFGEPYIRHGDVAELTSLQYPEKDGNYQVVSVERKFGMGGYRQIIELGRKI